MIVVVMKTNKIHTQTVSSFALLVVRVGTYAEINDSIDLLKNESAHSLNH